MTGPDSDAKMGLEIAAKMEQGFHTTVGREIDARMEPEIGAKMESIFLGALHSFFSAH